MVGRDHDGGGQQHAPVAVERQEGQRAEDVEVSLDAAAREVNQQRSHEHLSNADDVAGEDLARPKERQDDRQADDRGPQEEGSPHVQVRLTFRTHPGFGADPQRDGDASQPLKRQQPRKQAVGAPANDLLVLMKERRRPKLCCLSSIHSRLYSWHELSPRPHAEGLNMGQPKTGRSALAGFSPLTRVRMAVRPAFSPAWPREPVIPPLKTRRPFGS